MKTYKATITGNASIMESDGKLWFGIENTESIIQRLVKDAQKFSGDYFPATLTITLTDISEPLKCSREV